MSHIVSESMLIILSVFDEFMTSAATAAGVNMSEDTPSQLGKGYRLNSAYTYTPWLDHSLVSPGRACCAWYGAAQL